MRIQKSLLVIFLLCFVANNAFPQRDSRSVRLERKAIKKSDFVTDMFREWSHTGGVKIDSLHVHRDSLLINYYFNPIASHMPVRSNTISELQNQLKDHLGNKFKEYKINLWIRGRLMEEYVPNIFRDENLKPDTKRFSVRYHDVPLVTRGNRNYEKGLYGDHIALWPSHGFFFDQQLDRWQWQRARLWQTVEDIFPWSFTSSYLVPMLENAGANVLLPRERDTQVNEAIVDNDYSSGLGHIVFKGNFNKWDSLNAGFRWSDTIFPSQNPFKNGTCLTATLDSDDSLKVLYVPDIPADGYYAVHISYQKISECMSQVPYIVNYAGGSQEFYVNQCMGFGTWIYLGNFRFIKGIHPDSGSVSLSVNGINGRLSTDAIRFGGGMGNVARRPGIDQISRQRSANDGSVPAETVNADTTLYTWKISGKPRWMEGSRYYLQYAGMPDTLTYSLNQGKNDYNDDYMSRPEWVNFIAGPARQQYTSRYDDGLNIPVDLSVAFHTDAGITGNDSIIGTLGIYSTVRNDGIFPDGRSKMASRDLTDIVQTQLVNDIRNLMNPRWTRRGLWDREYSEAWRPVVPSMLLELLSHQNLADMKFGLDPRFKFTASRAIYKGILKYLSGEHRRDYVIQPLPPDHMAIEQIEGKKIRVSWQPVPDPLENSAVAEGFLVYRKTEDNGFAPPEFTTDNYFEIELPEWNTLYSFRVTAVNKGGESMPGETLSVSLLPDKKPVLVVNGFDRICAPTFFDTRDMAGIAWWQDEGVPYIKDLSFTGYQYNFDRKSEWLHDDSQGWGASDADLETVSIAGNTFEFPLIHGKAIRNSGNSFVSVSDEVFESDEFDLRSYEICDLIFGEERGTASLKDATQKEFRVYSPGMLKVLEKFTASGGNLFITGAYVGTDMVENGDSAAIQFAADVLHYIWRTSHATASGTVVPTDLGKKSFPDKISFNTEFRDDIYRVESPDAIEPVGEGAVRICRYESGKTSAGIAYRGAYRTIILGFPFETIVKESDRDELMKRVMEYFTSIDE